MTNEIFYMIERFNEIHQQRLVDFPDLSNSQFVRDFGSIQLSVPRGGGKTTYITTFADKVKDVVIVHQHERIRDYKRQGYMAFTLSNMDTARGFKPNVIYLDEVGLRDFDVSRSTIRIDKHTKIISLLTI